MKPHETIRKATAALAESVSSILDDSVTEDEQVQALAAAFAQAEGFLLEKFPDGEVRAGDFVKQLQYEGDLREAIKEAEAEDREKRVATAASSGPAIEFDVGDQHLTFPNKRALAVWLAVQERIRKSEETNTMTTTPSLSDIVKMHGVIAIAKAIVDDGKTYSLTEEEYTNLVTEDARRKYPDLTAAAAFEKLFMSQGDEGETIRQAHAAVKAATLEPIVTDGTTANPDDARAATEALGRLVNEQRARNPYLSTEQAWDAAMRERPDLAARAVPRLAPTSIYPMPR